MGASFTYAAVYRAEAVCRTPLRTGGTDGDPQRVLRDRDGNAFLQGASLAGALRGWLKAGPDQALTAALFGDQRQGGHLIVSDAVFDRAADQRIRPRLRIDSETGSAAVNEKGQGSKFDVAHMGTGSKLRFTLTWLGTSEQKDELSAVERMLAALDAGVIRLGAQKSNGFGQVSLSVERRLFDMTDPADRDAWLADRFDGEVLTLPSLPDAREIVFTVEGRADNILVKTAPQVWTDESGKSKTYTPNISEGGQAVLPGSSVKGAVRTRAAYIAKLLCLDDDFVDRYFGRDAGPDDNGLPGLVRFEDGLLSGQKKKVSRIRIDRFTGGVFRQGLFTEEPVSTRLRLCAAAPDDPAVCALLLYALRDLGLGLYSLGSGWAIGRGQVSVSAIRAEAPGGRRASLRFDGQGGVTQEDPSGLFRAWLDRLEEVRHEN